MESQASEKDEIGTAQNTSQFLGGQRSYHRKRNLAVVPHSSICGSERHKDHHSPWRKGDMYVLEVSKQARNRPSTPSCSWLVHYITFSYVKPFKNGTVNTCIKGENSIMNLFTHFNNDQHFCHWNFIFTSQLVLLQCF